MSLEEAICKAKVRVDIDDRFVTIERQNLTVAQASSTPTTNIGSYALQHVLCEDRNLSYDAKFWKGKCGELLHERDHIETLMTKKLCDLLERHENLSRYVKLLEQNHAGLSDKSSPNFTESSNMQVTLEKLRVYELLTSTTIDLGKDSEYVCTTRNPQARKATRFTLQKVEHPDGDILVHAKGNVCLLPDYLQQGDIVCQSAAVPVLLGDVLQTLYKEEEA